MHVAVIHELMNFQIVDYWCEAGRFCICQCYLSCCLVGLLRTVGVLAGNFIERCNYYFARIGEQSIVMSMSVYLSVRSHIFGTTRLIFTKFFMHAMAMARSSCGGIVMCYMTSYLHIS